MTSASHAGNESVQGGGRVNQAGARFNRWDIALVGAVALVIGLSGLSSTAQAQVPQSVPAARFYGTVTLPQGTPPTNLTITGAVGNAVCTGTQAIPQSQTNSGTANNASY